MSVNLARVLILGDGQLGEHLYLAKLSQVGELIRWSKDQCDFTEPREVVNKVKKLNPTLIINAAAYTQVDRAEAEIDSAMLINCVTPGRLAEYCREFKIPLIHFSTDYVYDGSGTEAVRETQQPMPLNAYGRTKLAGDEAIIRSQAQHLIFRTSWLYSEVGYNFFLTMLRLFGEKQELRIVSDQIGAPTYCGDLAQAVWQVLEQISSQPTFPSGVYHYALSGSTSWYGFTNEIFQLAQKLPIKTQQILPVTTAEYASPTRRPLNSRLNCEKIRHEFQLEIPSWQMGLQNCYSRWLQLNQKASMNASNSNLQY